MIGFDEAVRRVIEAARPLGSETVAITGASGRYLAAPVVAQIASPRAHVSAMDGYAVRDADLASLPARLPVVGQAFPGSPFPAPLQEPGCVRLFTGAPVPEGTDRVVIQEVVRREGDWAVIDEAPGPARHVRRRGSDFSEGDELLPAGRRLDPRALVAAAGADLGHVEVGRRPAIMLIGTGDELHPPGLANRTAQGIPESLSVGVAAIAEQWGAAVVARRRLRDERDELERAAAEALDGADLVVVTGGASVGDRDHSRAAFLPFGLDYLFEKVAIKPGKPVWLGRCGPKLVLGLPGNPTSAMVTARLLLAPLVTGLAGGDPRDALRWRSLPLASPLGAAGGRETFVRAQRLGPGAEPVGNQDSSAQRSLAEADLLLRLPAGTPARAAGDPVDALDF